MAALFFSASKIYQVATTNKLFHYIILTWRITIQFVMSSLDVASVNWWPDVDKVPEPRVRKRLLSPTNRAFSSLGSGTSCARNENLRPLLNKNIPLISEKYGFRNHF